ncbi:hypothetical protein C8Q75DRAFT_748872 [Abortiporus biennis]|nr:hypothetical protein C8Q75DRAFT_748872 [Abortiporus biennis]
MSLQHKELILQPQITTSNVKLSKIYHLWDDLTQYSVEAIAANRASIYDFIEHDCMYFAAVQRRVRVRVPGAEKISKLQTKSDKAFDDADDLAYESDCSHTSNFASLVPAKDADKPKNTRIIPIGTGLVYLTPSHFPGTVNLGVMIDPHARRNGYGSRVVRMVLSWAFDELRSHRVIVQVIGGDNSRRNIAARLFNSLGFTNEGISRRAIFCPAPPPKPDDPSTIRGDGQWQDVTTFSILDTDWMIRRNWTALPESFIKTKWEAMFMRHEIERDQMVAIEEEAEKRRTKVKRSTTMDSETVVDIEYMELTDDEKKQCSELLGEEFREEPIFDDDDLQNDSFNNDLSTPSMSMFQNPYPINYPYPTFPLDSLDNSTFRAGFYPTPFHLPAESSTFRA